MLKLLLPANSKPKVGFYYKNSTNKPRVAKVYRHNGYTGPRIDAFEVENVPSKTILQLLDELKSSVDPSISYRKSCREGACGSCGMNINKENRLACTTKLSDLQGEVEIYPLPHMKVIKDLVCDMSDFFKQYEKIKPWFVPRSEQGTTSNRGESDRAKVSEKQEGDFINQCTTEEAVEVRKANQLGGEERKELPQTPEERKRLDGLYECIMCACCSTQCPSYWWNDGKFIGPAALVQSLRFIKDSRDSKADERIETVRRVGGLKNCHTIFSCTTVCPKNLNPAKAIHELKSLTCKR